MYIPQYKTRVVTGAAARPERSSFSVAQRRKKAGAEDGKAAQIISGCRILYYDGSLLTQSGRLGVFQLLAQLVDLFLQVANI